MPQAQAHQPCASPRPRRLLYSRSRSRSLFTALATLKRDYLTLLDRDKLVDLLLALDNDCTVSIFPDNLPDAVDALRAAAPSPPPAPEAAPATVQPDAAAAPAPLYTSTPLLPNQLRLVAASAKPQIEPSEMPSYEEMIAQAIAEIADPDGTAPKVLFQWMDQCVFPCPLAARNIPDS